MNAMVDLIAELQRVGSQAGPWPTDESARLRALQATRVLQNYPAEGLQQLAEVAACVAETSMAFVSFIDYDSQHVLTGVNVHTRRDARFDTLCAYAISHPEDVTIVQDLFADPRFEHLRHVGATRNFRFYAGVAVLSPDGYPIGTLCVLDNEPRSLSVRQINALRNVAKAVTPRLALAMQVERLQAEQAKFQAFMNNSPALAFIKDAGGRYEYVNQRMLDHFQLTRDAIIGKTDADLWPGPMAEQLKANDMYVLTHGEPVELTEEGPADANGNPSWWQSYKFEVPGDHPAVGGVAFDVSAMKTLQLRFEKLSRTDVLTQLPNRAALQAELPECITRSRETGEQLAVLFLDIDHFKEINDTFGHGIGDAVLFEFSCRLREAVRHTDFVARLAGDEFVVVLERLTHATQAAQIAQKILEAMAKPTRVGGQLRPISASIGIAMLSDEILDAPALLERADLALYQAKAAGRNCAKGVA